jgi:lipoprotein-anchoring transpeptidase ErfK/SrfK
MKRFPAALFPAALAIFMSFFVAGWGIKSSQWSSLKQPEAFPVAPAECTFDAAWQYFDSRENRYIYNINKNGKWWGWLRSQATGWQWLNPKEAGTNPDYVAGADLATDSSVFPGFRETGGPCAGVSAGQCNFDTFWQYYDSRGTTYRMNVTRGGKTWTWIRGAATGWAWKNPKEAGVNANYVHGADLATDSSVFAGFRTSDGPCAGLAAGQCKFDTFFQYFDEKESRYIRNVTMNAKVWTWISNAGTNWDFKTYKEAYPTSTYIHGADIATQGDPLYRAAGAPCAGLAAGQCKFDTYIQFYDTKESRYVNTVMIGGKIWTWIRNAATGWAWKTFKEVYPTGYANGSNVIDGFAPLAEFGGPCGDVAPAIGTKRCSADNAAVEEYKTVRNKNISANIPGLVALVPEDRRETLQGLLERYNQGLISKTEMLNVVAQYLNAAQMQAVRNHSFIQSLPEWAVETKWVATACGSDSQCQNNACVTTAASPSPEGGACTFDSQTILMNPFAGDKLQWIITANRKIYSYLHDPSAGWQNHKLGLDLTDQSYYEAKPDLFTQANGPCAGKSAGQCHFDSQTIFANPFIDNKLQWIITANGKYYSYVHDPSAGWQNYQLGLDLTDQSIYPTKPDLFTQANGPCGTATSAQFYLTLDIDLEVKSNDTNDAVRLRLKQSGEVKNEQTVGVNDQGVKEAIGLNGLENATYTVAVKPKGYLSRKQDAGFTQGQTTSVSFSSSFLAGDINSTNDDTINSLDYGVFVGKYGSGDDLADFNGDGEVNSLDYSILLRNYGKSGEE